MKRILSVIATLFLLNLILIGQSQADIEQPHSNTFLNIDWYNIGQSFTAEITGCDYANIYACVGVDPWAGTGDVVLTLKLGSTELASGTSSVADDGMVTLDVSDVSFISGISYDFYLTSSSSSSRFARVYWEDNDPIGDDAYADGQLITSQGSVGGQPLSEYDLAFAVLSVPIPLCEGNFDNHGDVDGSDLAVFIEAYVVSGLAADLNDDDNVDEIDLGIFADEFGHNDCS